MKVGDRVRCIDGLFEDSIESPFYVRDLKLPMCGGVYTIRDVVETRYGLGIRLDGVVNRLFFYNDISRSEEPIFSIDRFKRC